MKSSLIIIRGNSASGKTTLAKMLQDHLGTDTCLLLQQDILRRNILHANDKPRTPAVDFISDLLKFGQKHYPIVILEGILRSDVYGDMLEKKLDYFDQHLIYYLDLPFDTTWEHNNLKKHPFTKDQLYQWWRDDDYLTNHEHLLKNDLNQNFHQILQDLKKLR